MRKIVALQTIRQGIPFVTARDKQAQLQGNPDIFEVLEVKRYEPVNHRELFSHSGDAMRSGGVGRELISRDEYERYKKMVELHGIIHGPFRTSEFLEFTDETEPHTHQNVQLPLVDGVTDWRLKLQTAFQVSSSGKKIPLVTSRNLSISAMQLHSYGDPLQPDKDYVVYEIAPNTVEIELRRDMDVSMTVVFTENTSVSSLTKEPINDSKEGQQRLQKFIDLLEQRSEPAYIRFAEKLKEGASNRMTIGDIVNIQRSVTDYSFNSSLHYLRSTSVLDQLSMFAREEHFTMQCGQSSELLLFCLTELFQGNDEIHFERVSGYNVDTDNISGILNTEEYFIQIRASDRHSLVKATRKGEVSYLDATGINVQRSRELPKTKRSIQDVNNRYKKQEELTFSSVVDQQLNWITNTMNNLVPPDKRRVTSDGGLGLIADLPHDDPLRQVVKLLLHYKDDKITEKDVRQSLIHIEEEFSLSSAEALRTYYMQLDGGRRAKKLAFLMQFLVTGTVQSILS